MASNVPIVRQIAWLSVLVQTLLIISLAFLYRFIFPESYFLLAIATFLVIFFLLRTLVPAQHRKGVRLFKQKKFEEAVPCFRASYEFFSKRRWIDKYRFITLLSSSRISYLEMALLNEAFCISQLEKKAEAIEKYENVLKEFPDSEMAISALKLLK